MPKFTLKAFSLIELVVVIAIFLTLLSLLQPSLSGLQKQAQNTVCKGNLKTIGGAAALQLEDYNGVLNPAGYIYNVEAPEINNPYMRVQDTIINPISAMSRYLNENIRYDTLRNHNRDVSNAEYFSDFKCPANEFQEGKDFVVTLAGNPLPDGTRIFRSARSHSSYGLNNGYLGIPSRPNHSQAAGEIKRVTEPSKFMHMGEFYTNNNWSVLSSWLSHMTLKDSYNAHTGNRLDWERHDATMNILFVDAHVETIDFYDMEKVYTAKGVE
jgi:prepilin-type processing-associated H-X9-DG protein/prepilin-type N-terminal cleavage/methylation domain-containing protein